MAIKISDETKKKKKESTKTATPTSPLRQNPQLTYAQNTPALADHLNLASRSYTPASSSGTTDTEGASAKSAYVTRNNTFTPSASVTAANNYLKQIRDGGYNRQWSKALDSLVDEYMGRGAFEYDPQSDALWQQAKSEGLRQGQLAMRDATAQASALSGGYGNSYAATVGNQVYQQAVADTMALQPEYIQAAYERYKAGGDELLQKASLAESMDDAAWNRYMTELGLAQDEADKLYEREYAEFADRWSRDYQTVRDAIEDQRYADSLAYEKERDRIADEKYWAEFNYDANQDRLDRIESEEALARSNEQDAYDKLVSLISSTGYAPTAEELTAAGMSDAEANAYADYYENQAAGEPAEDEYYTPYIRTGKTDDYGNDIYNYGGKEFTFGKGTNPYTGTVNPDIKNGTFKNGPSYQPDNIDGNKLKEQTEYEAVVNGGIQKVWSFDDGKKLWVWDATRNSYVDVTDQKDELKK